MKTTFFSIFISIGEGPEKTTVSAKFVDRGEVYQYPSRVDRRSAWPSRPACSRDAQWDIHQWQQGCFHQKYIDANFCLLSTENCFKYLGLCWTSSLLHHTPGRFVPISMIWCFLCHLAICSIRYRYSPSIL